jgi:hypothetical protein
MDSVRSLARDWRATAVGVAAGAVGFVAVYAATFVVQRDEVAGASDFVDSVAAALGPDAGGVVRALADFLEPDPGQVVAWLAYAAHRVPLELDADALGSSLTRTVDVQALPIWDPVLAYVAPVVLFAAGTGVAARRGPPRLAASWLTGFRLAFGYAAAAGVSLRWATYTRDAGIASVRVAPDPVSVVAACALYALAFGTAGAAVATLAASQVRDNRG